MFFSKYSKQRRLELPIRDSDIYDSFRSRGERSVAIGPFTAELGYELLYWIPWIKRQLESRNISQEDVLIISRGGAFPFYGMPKAGYLDIFECLNPSLVKQAKLDEYSSFKTTKQLEVRTLDFEILKLLGCSNLELIHPSDMFRLTGKNPNLLDLINKFDRFEFRINDYLYTDIQLDFQFDELLRFYSSKALNTKTASRLANKYSKNFSTSCLSITTEESFDDHSSITPLRGRYLDLSKYRLTNLFLQGALLNRCRSVLATYGGFSYLSAFHGKRTYGFTDKSAKINLSHDIFLQAALASAQRPKMNSLKVKDNAHEAQHFRLDPSIEILR